MKFGGQIRADTAGEDGKWMIVLDLLKRSSEPQAMMIDDVWSC